MGIFSKKEKNENLVKLERFESLFCDFLKADRYVSHRDIAYFRQEWVDFFIDINTVIRVGIIEEYS